MKASILSPIFFELPEEEDPITKSFIKEKVRLFNPIFQQRKIIFQEAQAGNQEAIRMLAQFDCRVLSKHEVKSR